MTLFVELFSRGMPAGTTMYGTRQEVIEYAKTWVPIPFPGAGVTYEQYRASLGQYSDNSDRETDGLHVAS